ncbi:MAG: threonine ammonia-lyase [Candidatus Methanomethylicia archaeon]
MLNLLVWRSVAEEVRKATFILQGVVHRTPLDHSNTLSRMTGGNVYLKLENLQKTGSFKVRGAYYKISKLSSEEKRRGVVTASAGNHAQGVAYAAMISGVKAIVVMPEKASPSKISATKSYGAEVILYGFFYDDAYRKARKIGEETGAIFIHPFNDFYVIAGNGTVGLEVISDLPDVDMVIVPMGGGGLASGVASIIKHLRNNTKIIGVEAEAAPKFRESLKHGGIVEVDIRQSLADGLITRKPGDLTFTIASEVIDDVVTVSEDEIAMSMTLLMERAKTIAEGAGAASVAALISGKINVKDRKVVAIISGGNVDLTTLYRVVMKGLSRMKRIIIAKCVLPDIPGTLKSVLEVITEESGNIVDITHNRLQPYLEPGTAEVQLIIEIQEPNQIEKIEEKIKKLGYNIFIQ